MQETINYKLKKSEQTDFINIEDINHNMDVIDEKLKETKEQVENVSIEVVDNLTSNDTDKPLSANMGKELNETKLGKTETAANSEKLNNKAASEYALVTSLADKLTNKRRTLSVSDLNNPNYPEPYVASTNHGLSMGLDINWVHVHYFRHEEANGFGVQVVYNLANEKSANGYKWTMKIRTSQDKTWNAWEIVQTTIPKGHYPITDANYAVADGLHCYFNSATLHKPSYMTDGIISIYGWSNGDTENPTKNPYVIQMAFSWHNDKVAFRKGLNGQWGNWNELLTTDNHAFYINEHGITMKDYTKYVNVRHIEGAKTPGLDGDLYLNWYNSRPVHFKANDGSLHTLQELFQSGREYKTAIANKLTTKGIPTDTNASWQVMVENIGKIGKSTVLTGITDQSGQYIPAVNLSKAKAVIAYVDMSEAIGSGKSGGYLMTGWYDLGINACTSFATGTQAFNRYIDLNLIVDKSSNYVKVTVENKFGYNGNLKYKSTNAPVTVVIFE